MLSEYVNDNNKNALIPKNHRCLRCIFHCSYWFSYLKNITFVCDYCIMKNDSDKYWGVDIDTKLSKLCSSFVLNFHGV